MAKPVSLSRTGHQPAAGSAASVQFGGWNRRRVSYCRGSTDTLTALKCAQCHQSHSRLQARADGLRGAGRRHPGQLGPVPLQQGVRVEVLNVLGAGDAFMSGCCAAGSTTKAGSRLAVTPTPAGRWWSPPRLRAGDADQSRTRRLPAARRIGAAPGRRRAPQPPAPGHQPPSAVAGAVHFRL